MLITILCTDPNHPINDRLEQWVVERTGEHDIKLCRDRNEVTGGDILFLVSCHQIITSEIRGRYNYTFVLHASDLPRGRGWSPHIWDLLAGSDHIIVTLLSAEDVVDSGAIWARRVKKIPRYALYDEVNELLFDAELELMDVALGMVEKGEQPIPQRTDIEPTYYPKRTPKDSELDPEMTLSELFNKIRLMDPERYPAYFYLYGRRFELIIRRGEE